jgi:uncharacterized protein (UPF0276 family)
VSQKLSKALPIPANKAGIGLRAPHIDYIVKNSAKIKKEVGWLEVHSENYYSKSNPSINSLIEIRKDFPISLHSVGNSLGSASGLDLKHLKKLKELVKIIDPFLVSDHISWGKVGEMHLNDLLPLPYTKAALKVIQNNVDQMQNFLGREILIENPSTYLSFKECEMSEFEFINEACKSTGCKLLLDVNNIFVSGSNNKEFNTKKYLAEIDKSIVAEIHLAGHSKKEIFDGKKNKQVLIDTHNDTVCKEVWELYEIAIKRFGEIPTLIEWDQDIPEFQVLLDEAGRAQNILGGSK